jgi:hypothetical protein
VLNPTAFKGGLLKNNKYVLTDESGILSISQGEAMVYDDLSFMTKAVAEKAVRLLSKRKRR